ncbi:hypothetical protein [Candidatus Finniella inopinata]|uniref:DUF2846 domain-containing protein n=1 Tax=Candidatus Finniella inopinata TaxID=1696036 RepID=A0A4Q7DN55_9PROT|nr:hypothetical protein [Candidatus Finniella inopinata]RZI46286.1 hypothetical protein EQU50_04950 [Candidatus Finniella inopinata]
MKKTTLGLSLLLALQISSAAVGGAYSTSMGPSQPTPSSNPVIKLNSETALLYVRNENKTPIVVLFKPQLIEDDPSVNSNNRITDVRRAGFMSLKLPPNSFIQIVVEKKILGRDVNLFSVTGEADVGGPLGTANNLSYGKIYIIKFTENAFGTSCFAEALDEPIKDFPQVQASGVETRLELPKAEGAPTPHSPL